MPRTWLLVHMLGWSFAVAACVGDTANTQPAADSSVPLDGSASDSTFPDTSIADAGVDATDACGTNKVLACGAGTPCANGSQDCCYKSGTAGVCLASDAGDASTLCAEVSGFGTFRCSNPTDCPCGLVCCAYVRNILQPASFPTQWTSSCTVKCPPGGTVQGGRILCDTDTDCPPNIHCKTDTGLGVWDAAVNSLPPGYKSCQP